MTGEPEHATRNLGIGRREGGRHSWWHNSIQRKRSAVPRHTEIDDNLARKICKDLGVPPVK